MCGWVPLHEHGEQRVSGVLLYHSSHSFIGPAWSHAGNQQETSVSLLSLLCTLALGVQDTC